MKTKIILLFAFIIIASAWKENKSTGNFNSTKVEKNSTKVEKGWTKISVLYAGGEGKTFDWNYYLSKHVPLVKNLLGDSVKVISVDKGIAGVAPNSPATYVAMFHMYFETISAYRNSFGPNADKIRKDIPNYTNIQPVVQISEVQQ